MRLEYGEIEAVPQGACEVFDQRTTLRVFCWRHRRKRSQPLHRLVVRQRGAARAPTIAGALAVAMLMAVRSRLAYLYREDPARQRLDLDACEVAPALLQLRERISARAALPGEDDPPQPGG